MTQVKICGLRTPDDVALVNQVKPDFAGFVLVPGRRRTVTEKELAALRLLLSPDIEAVGVFVNADATEVARLLNQGLIDYAQLHGTEDENYLAELRELTDRPLIKAFSITSAEDIQRALTSTANYLLFDHGAGGTGERFAWHLLADVERSYFLAGGLDADNVAEAIANYRPLAVDVSSGVEVDGRKNEARLRAFMDAVRGADQ